MVETALLERIEALPLRVSAAPTADHCRQPTALDEADFQDINAIVSTLKPIDQPDGWFCVARTGGRPFRCIDRIEVNGKPFVFDSDAFGAPPDLADALDAHFARGRTVNKLWCGHRVGDRWPRTLVLNGNGNLNIAGFHDALMAYLRDPETQRASPIRLTPPNDTGRLPTSASCDNGPNPTFRTQVPMPAALRDNLLA